MPNLSNLIFRYHLIQITLVASVAQLLHYIASYIFKKTKSNILYSEYHTVNSGKDHTFWKRLFYHETKVYGTGCRS